MFYYVDDIMIWTDTTERFIYDNYTDMQFAGSELKAQKCVLRKNFNLPYPIF